MKPFAWLRDEAFDLVRPDFESRVRHFEICRAAEDMPNAIQLLDDLSDELYWRVCQQKAIDTHLPSIVSSFMPKSGGTFLFNRLVLSCGYVEYHWAVSHPVSGQSIYAVPRALRNYLEGGCAHHSHFLPTPHNRKVLEDAGVRKVWVHVRHPCEVVRSAYFHYAGFGHGEGAIARERIDAALRDAAILGIDADPDSPQKFDAFFRDQLEWVVAWLRMWLLEADARPEFVHLTSHPQLGDPARVLREVFDAFGVSIEPDALPDALPEDRRRIRDSDGDWRSMLTPGTVAAASDLLERKLGFSAFGRTLCGLR